jgi:hypothetical protein
MKLIRVLLTSELDLVAEQEKFLEDRSLYSFLYYKLLNHRRLGENIRFFAAASFVQSIGH